MRRLRLILATLVLASVAGLGWWWSTSPTGADNQSQAGADTSLSEAAAVEAALQVAKGVNLTAPEQIETKLLAYNEYRALAGSVQSPNGSASWESDDRLVWVVTMHGSVTVDMGPPGLDEEPFEEHFDNISIAIDSDTGEILGGRAYHNKADVPF